MPPPVGAQFERSFCFDAATIRAGAALVGDRNPLHHDEDAAAASRYGELIASGAYTAAVLAGLLSEAFGPSGPNGHVGMEYNVQFLGPVRVNRTVNMEWRVAEHVRRRSGTVVRFEGRIVDLTDGSVAVSARLAALYFGAPAGNGGLDGHDGAHSTGH